MRYSPQLKNTSAAGTVSHSSRLWLLESGEEEDDPGAAVGEDEAGVQPGVVAGPDGRAVLLAKGLGIEGHGRHLACDCYWLGRELGRSAGAEGLAFECSDASLIRVMDK